MAYSTQMDFFQITSLNETLPFQCLKGCVKLKSYESSDDVRSWSNDENMQSKYFIDLMACRNLNAGLEVEAGENEASTSRAAEVKREKPEKRQTEASSRSNRVGQSGRKSQNSGVGMPKNVPKVVNEDVKKFEDMSAKCKKMEQELAAANQKLAKTAEERDELLSKVSGLQNKEKTMASEAARGSRASLEISKKMDKQAKYIECLHTELKKTENFYEDKIRQLVQKDQFLMRRVCSLEGDLASCKKENEDLQYALCSMEEDLKESECQLAQVMKVVEEMQYVSQENQTTERLADLAQFTTITLLEIKRELSNRMLCATDNASESKEKDEIIMALRKENFQQQNSAADLQHDCSNFCTEIFKKLLTMKRENEMLRNAYTECLTSNKEIVNVLGHHKINIDGLRVKVLVLDNLVDSMTTKSRELAGNAKVWSLLQREIKTVREVNVELSCQINELKDESNSELQLLHEKLQTLAKGPDMATKICQCEVTGVCVYTSTDSSLECDFEKQTNEKIIVTSPIISQSAIGKRKLSKRKSGGQNIPFLLEEESKIPSVGDNVIMGTNGTIDNYKVKNFVTDQFRNIILEENKSKGSINIETSIKQAKSKDFLQISNSRHSSIHEAMQVNWSNNSYNQFVAKHAHVMKQKVRKGSSYTKEVRNILDAFIVECGFCYCRGCVPQDKFYATCHQIMHYGLDNVKLNRLINFHDKIYKRIDFMKPGYLLQTILDQQIGMGGIKCCECKGNLCCTSSEEMLKEKVFKLEQEIAIARSYFDDLKSNSSSSTQLAKQCRNPSIEKMLPNQIESTTYSIKSRFSTCRSIVGF